MSQGGGMNGGNYGGGMGGGSGYVNPMLRYQQQGSPYGLRGMSGGNMFNPQQQMPQMPRQLPGGMSGGNMFNPSMLGQKTFGAPIDYNNMPNQASNGGNMWDPATMPAANPMQGNLMAGRRMFSQPPNMGGATTGGNFTPAGAPPPPGGNPPPPPGYTPPPNPTPFVPPQPQPQPGTQTPSGNWGPPQGPYGGGANGLIPFNTAWGMGGPMGPTVRPTNPNDGWNQMTGKWEPFQ